jgi:hypothetical protein
MCLKPCPNWLRDGGLWFVDGERGAVYLEDSVATTTATAAMVVPRNAVRVGGAVVLATRDVEAGEELFYNYELSGSDLPEWYHPVR